VKFYARKRRSPQVIIVSLIDIFAILLIFVIVTTTFKKAQPEVTIKLPESKSAVAAEKSDDPVVISISEKEEIFLDEKPVQIADLKSALAPVIGRTPPPPLALKADKKVSYGFFISVIDALKDAGVKASMSAFTDSKK
jgi:biopolymer transport protein ExbD